MLFAGHGKKTHTAQHSTTISADTERVTVHLFTCVHSVQTVHCIKPLLPGLFETRKIFRSAKFCYFFLRLFCNIYPIQLVLLFFPLLSFLELKHTAKSPGRCNVIIASPLGITAPCSFFLCVGLPLWMLLTKFHQPQTKTLCLRCDIVDRTTERKSLDSRQWKQKDRTFLRAPRELLLSSGRPRCH